MKTLLRRRVLLIAAVLAVAFVLLLAVMQRVYTAGLQTRNFGHAVFAFASERARMPQSIDELVQAGYARPADQPGTYTMLVGPQGSPLDPPVAVSRFEVAWGLQPDQLVEGDKGIFWRDEPSKHALLVRHTDPPLIVRALGGRMAMAFPPQLYHRLSGQIAATQTPPAPSSQPARSTSSR